jgi:hypothetical protein
MPSFSRAVSLDLRVSGRRALQARHAGAERSAALVSVNSLQAAVSLTARHSCAKVWVAFATEVPFVAAPSGERFNRTSVAGRRRLANAFAAGLTAWPSRAKVWVAFATEVPFSGGAGWRIRSRKAASALVSATVDRHGDSRARLHDGRDRAVLSQRQDCDVWTRPSTMWRPPRPAPALRRVDAPVYNVAPPRHAPGWVGGGMGRGPSLSRALVATRRGVEEELTVGWRLNLLMAADSGAAFARASPWNEAKRRTRVQSRARRAQTS